jgi:hypothetical protein
MSQDIVKDLQSLGGRPKTQKKQLKPKQTKQPIPATTSKALAVLPTTEGGGIASPLTEVESSRTFYPEQEILSSDGFFSLVFQNTQQITILDSNDQEVKFNLEDVDINA